MLHFEAKICIEVKVMLILLLLFCPTFSPKICFVSLIFSYYYCTVVLRIFFSFFVSIFSFASEAKFFRTHCITTFVLVLYEEFYSSLPPTPCLPPAAGQPLVYCIDCTWRRVLKFSASYSMLTSSCWPASSIL